jgi:hypothetical protein
MISWYITNYKNVNNIAYKGKLKKDMLTFKRENITLNNRAGKDFFLKNKEYDVNYV